MKKLTTRCECGHSVYDHKFTTALPPPCHGFCKIEGCKCMHFIVCRHDWMFTWDGKTEICNKCGEIR